MAKSGLLCEREELIKIGIEGIENTYLYADGGVNDKQGFYRDGSYIFHTLHPMNYTYGMGHFNAVVELAELLCGSEFELSPEKKELIYTWLYKSFVPFYRNGIIGRGVLGRHPLSSKGAAFGLLRTVSAIYAVSDEARKGEISALLRMLVAEHPQFKDGRCDEFFAGCNLSQYLNFMEAYAHGGEMTWSRNGMYAFNSMDRALVEKYLLRYTSSVANRIVNENIVDANATYENRTRLAEYYSYALMGFISCWVSGGMNENPVHISKSISKLIKSGIVESVKLTEDEE
jgi:hypothetical protein